MSPSPSTTLTLLVVAVTGGCQGPTQTKPASSLDDFAARLESLRATGHIQALSAVISKDQSIVWGYTWNGDRYVPTAYQTAFSTAAGLTASARDYAALSMAMDRDAFLKPATKVLAWTPVVSPAGQTFPYGLGWFATDYKGIRVIWHYGYWTASATLVIKIPSQGLTFVLLANTDGLSAPYPLGSGKLESSPWAREFLETFAIAKLALP